MTQTLVRVGRNAPIVADPVVGEYMEFGEYASATGEWYLVRQGSREISRILKKA